MFTCNLVLKALFSDCHELNSNSPTILNSNSPTILYVHFNFKSFYQKQINSTSFRYLNRIIIKIKNYIYNLLENKKTSLFSKFSEPYSWSFNCRSQNLIIFSKLSELW